MTVNICLGQQEGRHYSQHFCVGVNKGANTTTDRPSTRQRNSRPPGPRNSRPLGDPPKRSQWNSRPQETPKGQGLPGDPHGPWATPGPQAIPRLRNPEIQTWPRGF